jgi:hypothetical protein
MGEESNEIYALAEKVAKDLPPDQDTPVAYSREGVMSPNITHFPLRKAWLCLQCENVTNNGNACPSCTSTHLKPLSELIEPVIDRHDKPAGTTV